MADTCTCTCDYCGRIREGNAGDQESSWFQRNFSLWNLVKLTLFGIVLFLITVCATPLAIFAGGMHGCLLGQGVASGMSMYTMLWALFAWYFGKKFLLNWCPTCSNRCRINNTKRLARQVFNNVFLAVHPWHLDVEAPEIVPERPPRPPRADERCTLCARENFQGNLRTWDSRRFERCGHGIHSRCLMHRLVQHDICPVCTFDNGRVVLSEGSPQRRQVGVPPPPPPPPPRADQPCTICARENLQGNRRTWDSWRFESCGHGYHSRCLMHKLVQHDTCPVCTFDNRHLVGNPRGHEGARIPEDCCVQ